MPRPSTVGLDGTVAPRTESRLLAAQHAVANQSDIQDFASNARKLLVQLGADLLVEHEKALHRAAVEQRSSFETSNSSAPIASDQAQGQRAMMIDMEELQAAAEQHWAVNGVPKPDIMKIPLQDIARNSYSKPGSSVAADIYGHHTGYADGSDWARKVHKPSRELDRGFREEDRAGSRADRSPKDRSPKLSERSAVDRTRTTGSKNLLFELRQTYKTVSRLDSSVHGGAVDLKMLGRSGSDWSVGMSRKNLKLANAGEGIIAPGRGAVVSAFPCVHAAGTRREMAATPPQGGLATALLIASATGDTGDKRASRDGLPGFEPADAFDGPRKNMAFKLGDQGLGYYPDPFQTLIAEVRPKLPERWREVGLREEELRVDKAAGAGVSLEHSEFGFAVEAVKETPGQSVQAGDVIVAIEGRLLAGLTAPQMQASFIKRRADGARLTVANLCEAKEISTRDPNIVECWDASSRRVYYFHRKTGKSGWTPQELSDAANGGATSSSDAFAGAQSSEGGKEGAAAAPPVDLSNFLLHGYSAPKEAAAKKKKRKEPDKPEKDESDLAREEAKRWAAWNEGGRGGYTEQFLMKYKNCTSFPTKPKEDKRLKGSVGPGQGMEYMARWTGSKNSFY